MAFGPIHGSDAMLNETTFNNRHDDPLSPLLAERERLYKLEEPHFNRLRRAYAVSDRSRRESAPSTRQTRLRLLPRRWSCPKLREPAFMSRYLFRCRIAAVDLRTITETLGLDLDCLQRARLRRVDIPRLSRRREI
jgi:hypothetical protein